MEQRFGNNIDMAIIRGGRSRAITAENSTGAKGNGGKEQSVLGRSRKGRPCIPEIMPGETKVLADIKGCGTINHIWMTVTDKISDKNRFVFRDLVLRMYWDNQETPSVECPLGDFFCCGFAVSYPVNSMPIVVIPRHGFNSYFSMPFRDNAKITIENQNEESVPSFFFQIDYCLYDNLPAEIGYFQAQFRRSIITEVGRDHVILDGVEGCGQYVGTFLALSTLERYWWGEGEVKFYLDGDRDYPTICGTGTEDYFGGAWSFAVHKNGIMTEQLYNTPYLGYPFYSRYDEEIYNNYHNNDCPPMRGLYRFHLPDPICFSEDIKVTLQQIGSCYSGIFERQDDVSTVAYWYQKELIRRESCLPKRVDRHPR